MSPREYWRARTIKMMHAHEIAEIAEIQEVARRALGEASVVPKAQTPEDTAPRQEQQGADEIGSADATEPLISSSETISGELELVATESEVEGVAEVEELIAPLTTGAIPEGENVESEMELSRAPEAAILDSGSESSTEEGDELGGSEKGLDKGLLELEVPEQSIGLVSEEGTEDRDESSGTGTLMSTLGLEESENESTSVEVEEEASVLREVSEVEDVPFAEGVVGVGAELESMEEESGPPKLGEEAASSSEISEAKEIAELEEDSELPGETADTELPEWQRSEALRRESADEVSAPVELPVEGGVERPSSPVRIITFREGGTEIGICPYCGRFVRGSDLARHKLKHRVRNVLGFQREE